MSSMKQRLITASIGIPLIIAMLILSEYFSWIIYITFSLACVIMSIEILSVKKLHSDIAIVLTCVLFSFAEPLLCTTVYRFVPVYLFIIALIFIMLVKNKKIHFDDIAFMFACNIVIVFCFVSMILLYDYYGGLSSFVFVLSVGIPWIADGGAYFVGVFLGKHKLCPNISPNKTIEGFIGGLVSGVISAPIIGFIFTLIYSDFSVDYFALVILGLLSSFISVLGDLTFSLIKRSNNIKDYGSFFPGHGGFLDRFDSVIFVAPLVYLFCSNIGVVI